MIDIENQKPERLEIKSKWIYYGAIIDRYVYQFLYSIFAFYPNCLIDKIGNENNFNWSPQELQNNLGILTTTMYIGSATGALLIGFFTNYNTRHLYAAVRIGSALSLILGTSKHFYVMVVARFFMGFFCDAAMEVGIWSFYEILLPRHKDRVMTMIYFIHALNYFACNFVGSIDNDGFYFWRICLVVSALMIIFSAIASLVFVPHVNTFTYMLQSIGEERTLETISHYYEDETAVYLTQKYKKEIMLHKGQSNRGEFEEESLVKQTQDPGKFSNPEKSGISLLIKEFRYYWRQAIHMAFFTIASMLSFNETLYQFSIYY